jgi:hypothetical protein
MHFKLQAAWEVLSLAVLRFTDTESRFRFTVHVHKAQHMNIAY